MLTRPKTVSVAYWLWLAASVILVLFGLLALTSSGDAIRQQLVDNGVKPDNTDSFLVLLRGVGVGSLIVGIVTGLLSGPVRSGDPRFRRALVTLSGVFALLQIAAVLLGLSPAFLLIVPLLLVSAGILVFRQSSALWFEKPGFEKPGFEKPGFDNRGSAADD
ncbi:hypothetical protein [Antrihabitans cavernicola]|uniref:Uncharacterized protein n=1 Tax=Antrihabitans cavernicola TaxID=2495913 RepID=A0A5A7S870_9NOCA|nr:hypothetical protein [Spelaeibacter cavernicola]KAA0022358.1 hypothetical protein FOY51_15440 [Spelaeibacter cavernicola]